MSDLPDSVRRALQVAREKIAAVQARGGKPLEADEPDELDKWRRRRDLDL